MEIDSDADLKQVLTALHQRDLTAGECKMLQALAELSDELEWRDALYPKDLEAFCPDFRSRVEDPARPISESIWTEKPLSPRSLAPYLAYLLESHQAPVPDFLRPIADTSSIRARIQSRALEKDARFWKNRLGSLSQQRRLSNAAPLEVRLKLQGKILRWEFRQDSEAPFEALAAKDFGQWLTKDLGFLDRFEASCIPLCALFQEFYRFSQRARLDLDKEEDCAFLNKLLRQPATNPRIVNRQDQPLAYAETRLQWTGSAEGPNADGLYALRLALADGREAPFPLIYLPGEQPLYLAGETLYHGPALLRGGDDPNRPFRIPASAMEAPEGLLFLRNHGLPLPPAVGDKVVYIPTRATLYCSLRSAGGEWTQRRFIDCRLVASSPDQRYHFVLADGAWEPTDHPESGEPSPPAPEGGLFELPPVDYQETVLQAFGLEEIEDAGLWSKQIDDKFPPAFIDWIHDLPSEIQLAPDEELDTLVDGRPAGRYALVAGHEASSDWFDIALNSEFLDTSLTDSEKAAVMKAGGDYAYLPGKGWKRFEASVDTVSQDLLDSLGLTFEAGTVTAKHALHALQLADADLEGTELAGLQSAIRKRAKELSAKTPTHLPKGIRSQLRPYQIEGFKFLAFLSHNRFGGVLADDMGLGKTLQTLTWLAWLKQSRPPGTPFHCLVVCPKSVMHVWKQEVDTHTTGLSLALYDADRFFPAAWKEAGIDILVANYSQLRSRGDFFLGLDWTVSILDEAQYIKNPTSQTARVARELRAENRLALTGTPVENRALDLWSIFAYAMPGLLGSRSAFAAAYKENDSQTPQRLSRRTRHFMLRRSKRQVAPDLPERIEESLVCEMEGEQLDLYRAELKLAQTRLLGIDSAGAFDRERFHILASLLRLRQICCHPGLIDPAYANARSAKLEALVELVVELREEGHKVLVFSQFVEMLKIIGAALDSQDCPYLVLTGQTQNREELVDQFQNDPNQTAFLLSLRAAGSGLNLTAASYVVLYDPWWNPAVEAQAIDRAHRIGQKNTVNAYRLIAKDSIEQKIQSLQYKKEALASEIVREESLTQILDLDNLKYVLSQ